jgi:hypothetical protein
MGACTCACAYGNGSLLLAFDLEIAVRVLQKLNHHLDLAKSATVQYLHHTVSIRYIPFQFQCILPACTPYGSG